MSAPVFHNRENEHLVLPDGREVWLSRAVAVVGAVFADVHKSDGGELDPASRVVLMVQRGPGCPDNVGKWVMPCGYLDYDETLGSAAMREVYEESGLDISALPGFYASSFATGQPVFVYSDFRSDSKQNVSCTFSHLIRVVPEGGVNALSKLPALDWTLFSPDEVTEARWVPMQEIGELEIAFGHAERIRSLSYRVG